ncbi:hypothetical protein C8R44DRAFT_366282 [Mycena epipterygia]|nr:hypothetical protein C8R44DRAFT_366282 [Mycena epipterygia]
MASPSATRDGTSTSQDRGEVSLNKLPRELILLIFDYLPERDLIKLYEVSSSTKELALLVILARYGVSESQIQSQELPNVSSRALRSLSACYPTILPHIRTLDLHFDDGDVDHLAAWRSLMHLAERFPAIPSITLTFPERPTHLELWAVLPTVLISLMGDISRPAVIIHSVAIVVVRPRPPSILKRAWKTSTGSSATPVIARQKLTRKLQSSIATAIVFRPLSSVQVRLFTQPEARLGSLVILEPASIFYLNLNEQFISRPEWQFIMTDFHLPSLRTLFIRIDLDHHPLSVFLDRHNSIEHLEFTTDCGPLHSKALPPFPISALPRLKHISASARVIACVLQTSNDFSFLEHVCIAPRDSSSNDPDGPAHLQMAFRAMAARSSVNTLMLYIRSGDPPWKELDAKEARAEHELHSVQELHLLPWTQEAEYDTFPSWLAMFPALKKLTIAGNIFQSSKRGPLVSARLMDAVKTTCPHIVVKQERRLG